jgi:hypothetical protein
MIQRATVLSVLRFARQGRTRPLVANCVLRDGTEVELICKLSAGCEEGVIHLAKEALAACLATDLGLPVPKPFLVEIPQGLEAAMQDADVAKRIANSSALAFGSTRVSEQFSIWLPGSRISEAMLPVAAAIFLFDAIIQNPDRRDANPNCLTSGEEIRIIDHELAFPHLWIARWKPPWQVGSMDLLTQPGQHIFFAQLRQRKIDFTALRAAWAGLSEAHLQAYKMAMPAEWAAGRPAIDKALGLIADARDRIDDCISELGRILA